MLHVAFIGHALLHTPQFIGSLPMTSMHIPGLHICRPPSHVKTSGFGT
jgi:hypothetical protein